MMNLATSRRLILTALALALPLAGCRRNAAEPPRAAEQNATPVVVREAPAFVRCGDEKREAWKLSGRRASLVSVSLPANAEWVDVSVCAEQQDTVTPFSIAAADGASREASGWVADTEIVASPAVWKTKSVAVAPTPDAKGQTNLSLRVSPRAGGAHAAADVYVSVSARLEPPKDRPNILLVSIDTLRADRLSTYGYRQTTSLNIEGLAREGVVFTHAIAQATSTPPSHASMLTGCYPAATGLFITHEVGSTYDAPDFRLKASVPTLAEILRANGYRTVAATGGGFVGTRFGFGRGFEVFAEDQSTRPEEFMRLTDRVLSWLDGNPRAPWFVFLHTYTVHRGPNGYEHRSFEAGLPSLEASYAPVGSDAVARAYNARYDSGVLFADVTLGRIFDWLYFSGQAANTIVVVTSDHGETLHERQAQAGFSYNHGYAFYEELIRVPLVIRAPQRLPGNVRVDRPVEIVDIVPTVLELAGLRHPTGAIAGQSLVGLAKGTGGYGKETAFIESSPGGPFRAAVRSDRYKYVRVLDWKPSFGKDYGMTKPPEEELYDLLRDPQEKTNLASRPAMAAIKAGLRKQLEQRVAKSGTMDLIRGARNSP